MHPIFYANYQVPFEDLLGVIALQQKASIQDLAAPFGGSARTAEGLNLLVKIDCRSSHPPEAQVAHTYTIHIYIYILYIYIIYIYIPMFL